MNTITKPTGSQRYETYLQAGRNAERKLKLARRAVEHLEALNEHLDRFRTPDRATLRSESLDALHYAESLVTLLSADLEELEA